MQTRGGSGVVKTTQLHFKLLAGVGIGSHLRGSGFYAALKFVAPCAQGPRLEACFLRLALDCTQSLTGICQAALSRNYRVFQLDLMLLGRSQMYVKLFKTTFAGGAALFQGLKLSINFSQLVAQLVASRQRRLGLLREAEQLHLQLMRSRLMFSSLAPCEALPL